MKIEFYRHNISQKDIQNAKKVLCGIFLTTGKITKEFEKKFSQYLNCKQTIGVTSCTAAMELSLRALGVGPNDEVITTPLSFVATANAILQAGATPVFVDVEKETGNINADLIEKAITKKTKAILPVHLYGQMADMKKLRKIADKHKLKIIEDSAHCIEGKRDGVRPGHLGDTACFSFYATKSVTCGEGGGVTLNNEKVAKTLKKMRLHGLEQSAFESYEKKFLHPDMKIFGLKYNMDNVQAALLLNQLDLIEKRWRKKEKLAQKYERAFKNMPRVDFPETMPNVKHGRHLFTIWVDSGKRNQIRERLRKKGIPTTVNYYPPIHLMTFYRRKYGYKPGDFPIAEEISKRTITLPLYPKLKDKEVNYVIRSISETI